MMWLIDQMWNLEEPNSRSDQGGNGWRDLQLQPFTSWLLCTQLPCYSKIVLTHRCAQVMWFEWKPDYIMMMSWIIYLEKWDRRSMGGVVKCCKCCNHQDCQHLGWSEDKLIFLSYQQRSFEFVFFCGWYHSYNFLTQSTYLDLKFYTWKTHKNTPKKWNIH